MKETLKQIFSVSSDVVAREIEGEIILVPLTAGVGNLEDELYTLNETGRAIWNLLDGKRTLKDVADSLTETYQAQEGVIEQDVLGIVSELVNRRILVEVTSND